MNALFKKNGPVSHIRINRPEKLNALNQETITQLMEALERSEKEEEIKVILLTGQGDKAFCAGGDVKEVYHASLKKGSYEKKYLEHEFDLNKLLMSSKKIVITHLKGIAMGGGIALPMGGDYILADETTLFALPEIDLAMIPDVGLGYYISKLSQAKAMYLTLLGKTLKAHDIMDFGFATHYIKNSSWRPIVHEIESLSFETKGRKALKPEIEKILQKYSQPYGLSDFERNKDFYIKHFTKDSLEEIFTSLSEDSSSFGQEVLGELQSKCPIASQLIFHKYFIGQNWSREETFFHDSRILEYCYNYGNMKEGIRSILIDRDQANFGPETIKDINVEKIKSIIEGTGEI